MFKGADHAFFCAVPLIDVLWLEQGNPRVAAAFEVEHTTSIHSGIMRMVDLALCGNGDVGGLFLVAPDDREGDVRKQLARPAMKAVSGLRVRYLSYGDLDANRDAMARFGHGLRPVEAIARALCPRLSSGDGPLRLLAERARESIRLTRRPSVF